MRMKKNNKGFTLIEVLIVVSVIGILVAICIPTLTNQLEKARRAVDISNAGNIKSGLATSLNMGELEIKDDTTEIVLHVSGTKIDGGVHGKMDNVYINGVRYPGFKSLWNLLSTYGISDQIRMMQKDNDVEWYAVTINGKGQTFYYEGKGNMNDYKNSKVATKYNWDELST